MELINKATGKVIGTILTNHSMTIEECIECLGGKIISNTDAPRWSDDGDNEKLLRGITAAATNAAR